MNQSSDDLRLRELVQRLKRADEQHVPVLDDVLERAVRPPDRRPARRLARRVALAVMCCTAAALLAVFLFVRLQPDDPVGRSEPRFAENVTSAPSDARIEDIDFDHLRRVVDEHFIATKTTNGMGAPVWSSHTESLLAVNLNVSLTQE